MHLGYKVKVEWEIRGLEWKWLMKQFDSTKDKCSRLFYATTILTNFLRKCFLNFTYKIIGNSIKELIDYEWDGDF